MASQKKISSFFSPTSLKRGQAENSCDAKRQKRCFSTSNSEFVVGDEQENTSSKENRESEANTAEEFKKRDSAAALSPQQKQVISSNKLQAEMKKAARTSGGLVINIGSCWFTAVQKEFTKPYFQQLSQFVCDERKKKTIYPPSEHVFSFTQRCPINKVKVVILGQDPYHGPNQAHGLCFSVQKGISPPPSLQNMYKELETDVCGFKHPGHGDLTGWAQQGVLLLNAVLTVQAHNANSHKDRGWEKFTDAVITYINDELRGVVFILWGAYAQKKGARIDKKKHHVLKGVHPSPLSAHRGYFGCKHFSQCNQLLEKSGKSPIDWKHLP